MTSFANEGHRRLAALCKAERGAQRRIAEQLDMHEATLSTLLRRGSCGRMIANKIAARLGIPTTDWERPAQTEATCSPS